jgi:hypothetical protein
MTATRNRLLGALLLGLTLAAGSTGCDRPPISARLPRPSQPPGPVLEELRTSPKTLTKDQAMTLTVSASDRDGKPLTYTWSASAGTLSGTSGTSVTWKPTKADGTLEAPGLAKVSVVISNGKETDTGAVIVRLTATGASVVTGEQIPQVVTTPSSSPSASPAPSTSPGASPSASPTATPPAAEAAPFSSTDASGQGLSGAFYALDKGATELPADLDSRTPQASFTATALNIGPSSFTGGFPGNVTEYFALRYTGQLEVKQAGLTDFTLLSDAGARLLIDGQTVADDLGKTRSSGAKGTVDLTAGKHKLQVDYFHGAGSQVELRLLWAPPASADTAVPAEAFSTPGGP